MSMRSVPRWTLLSSGSAPVLLVGGWAAAGALQRPGYNPVTETISALASYGAADRWLMTGAMLVVGACYVVTAIALRAVALPGRVALACGGAAVVLVAFSPEPSVGTTPRHTAAAAVAVVSLAVWPCLAADRSPTAPWALRTWLSTLVTVVLLLTALWFLFELRGHGIAGVAERVVTGAEALWPFVVVASCLRLTTGAAPQGVER
jgi:hypothetical membrane protein